MDYPLISADSHITEAPDTYTAHIDRAWRDKAPRIVSTEHEGDVFQIDGRRGRSSSVWSQPPASRPNRSPARV